MSELSDIQARGEAAKAELIKRCDALAEISALTSNYLGDLGQTTMCGDKDALINNIARLTAPWRSK